MYMYRHCVTISETACSRSAQSYLGHGRHTSVTKLIDNAIVGYGKKVLRIRPEEAETREPTSGD